MEISSIAKCNSQKMYLIFGFIDWHVVLQSDTADAMGGQFLARDCVSKLAGGSSAQCESGCRTKSLLGLNGNGVEAQQALCSQLVQH